jgi:hypothetical protein
MSTWAYVMDNRANTLLLVIFLTGISYVMQLDYSSWQKTEMLKFSNGLGCLCVHSHIIISHDLQKHDKCLPQEELLILFVAVDLTEDYIMKSIIVYVHSSLSLYTNSDLCNKDSVSHHLSHQICIAVNHLLLHVVILNIDT